MESVNELGRRGAPRLVGDPSRRALHLIAIGQACAGTLAIFIQPPIVAFAPVLIMMIAAITANQMSNRPWKDQGWHGIAQGLRWAIPAIVLMCLIFYVALTVSLNTPPKPV